MEQTEESQLGKQAEQLEKQTEQVGKQADQQQEYTLSNDGNDSYSGQTTSISSPLQLFESQSTKMNTVNKNYRQNPKPTDYYILFVTLLLCFKLIC